MTEQPLTDEEIRYLRKMIHAAKEQQEDEANMIGGGFN